MIRPLVFLACASVVWSYQPGRQPTNRVNRYAGPGVLPEIGQRQPAVSSLESEKMELLTRLEEIKRREEDLRRMPPPPAEKPKKEAILDMIKELVVEESVFDEEFDKLVKFQFPGAMTNAELKTQVVDLLAQKGYHSENTLLATSLCSDELARKLEDEFIEEYGTNFNLGGLAGFSFAGNTGFGAMSGHIPDDGFCLIVYGPHVGITQDGAVGKVERSGIDLVDNCCGSAIKALGYARDIYNGKAEITPRIQDFADFQQGAVQELILPHAKRLSTVRNPMKHLPYALFESQDALLQDLVVTGINGLKRGTAVLGGIQINTGPNTPDYFHPLRFEYLDGVEKSVDDLLPLLTTMPSELAPSSSESLPSPANGRSEHPMIPPQVNEPVPDSSQGDSSPSIRPKLPFHSKHQKPMGSWGDHL